MGRKSNEKKQRRELAESQNHGQKMLSELKAKMPKDELAADDLELVEELLETGREMLNMHRAETKARIAGLKAGSEPPKRWQVSPTVAGQAMRLMEKLINHRRILNGFEPIFVPKPPRKKTSASTATVVESNKLSSLPMAPV
ncbi:MAG: hypothetical protein L3J82_05245 [Planctomycetes bacterium]|nr:hypothetical protein [Planctomycetota bacterium]